MKIITKPRKTEQIFAPLYFNPETFQAICADAVKAGFRPALLQPRKQKEHGFEGQLVWQRKGIAKFLKFCWKYWKETQAERAVKLAELALKKKQLEEEGKKLGVG